MVERLLDFLSAPTEEETHEYVKANNVTRKPIKGLSSSKSEESEDEQQSGEENEKESNTDEDETKNEEDVSLLAEGLLKRLSDAKIDLLLLAFFTLFALIFLPVFVCLFTLKPLLCVCLSLESGVEAAAYFSQLELHQVSFLLLPLAVPFPCLHVYVISVIR